MPICRDLLPMRAEGLEPPRAFAHRLLRPACLPIPPRPRVAEPLQLRPAVTFLAKARRPQASRTSSTNQAGGRDPSRSAHNTIRRPARVPKSVKGAVSKAAARKSLWVRVPPRACERRANRDEPDSPPGRPCSRPPHRRGRAGRGGRADVRACRRGRAPPVSSAGCAREHVQHVAAGRANDRRDHRRARPGL